MGYFKEAAKNILLNTFKEGNEIALVSGYTEGSGGSVISGEGFSKYKIKNGDFGDSEDGGICNKAHLLYGLAESGKVTGTADGMVVYEGDKPIYGAKLTTPLVMDGSKDVVPVFKKYEAGKDTGIHVTLDSVTATASASDA